MSKADTSKPTTPPSGQAVDSTAAADGSPSSKNGLTRLVLELIQPYRGWLIVVFIAMLLETAMSIAAPWPLKIILDNVVGKHKLPEFLAWLRDFSSGEYTLRWPAWPQSRRC